MNHWTIIFRPEGDGPPDAIRVRRLLKTALRHHRLRCIDMKCEQTAPDSHAGERSAPASTTHTPERPNAPECEPCGLKGNATTEGPTGSTKEVKHE